jgi:hypothetical protein
MKTFSTMRAALAAGLVLASGLAAAQLTLYRQPGFSGGDYTLNDSMRDLKGTGMYDQASSAVVRSGRWEVCTQPDFKGECVVLGPGRYARLDDKVFHRAESVRELRSVARSEPSWRGAPERRYRDQRYSAVEVYTQPNFRGFAMKLDDAEEAVARRVEDEGISSLIVHEGTWQLCSRGDYNGYCRTFEPGRYPRLGRLDGQPIGSLKRVG